MHDVVSISRTVGLSVALLAGLGGVASPASATADPLGYGPDTCVQGFVWREARTGDTVCVTPSVRAQVALQNSTPDLDRSPFGGDSGKSTCLQGFVWREAFDGDTICVTPDVRSATWADNAAAPSRRQANQPSSTPTPASGTAVVFEVTGPGEVFSIDTDPPGPLVGDHTPLPFSRTTTVGPDVHLLQVVAVGRDDPGPGCRITLNGRVVAEEPVGGSAHCIFTRP